MIARCYSATSFDIARSVFLRVLRGGDSGKLSSRNGTRSLRKALGFFYTPQQTSAKGHWRTFCHVHVMSALRPKADRRCRLFHLSLAVETIPSFRSNAMDWI